MNLSPFSQRAFTDAPVFIESIRLCIALLTIFSGRFELRTHNISFDALLLGSSCFISISNPVFLFNYLIFAEKKITPKRDDFFHAQKILFLKNLILFIN
jgi:hypothetical protein